MGQFSVGDIYDWVYALSNVYQSGQWSDDQFNLACKVVNIELLREEAGLPEGYSPNNPEPAISWQITNRISDDLINFIKPVILNQDINGYFPVPDDYYGFSSMWYEYKLNPAQCHGQATSQSKYIEPVSDDELRTRLSSNIKAPDFRFPIVAWYQYGFQVYPIAIKKVEFTYLRIPVTPVWAYTILPDGQAQYDPVNSVQPEWPDSLIPNFAVRVCRYLAINLREDQLLKNISERIAEGN